MLQRCVIFCGGLVLALATVGALGAEGKYQNFKVAVYCRAQEVQQMGEPAWLAANWKTISEQLSVDKVYLETHRDTVLVDDATLEKVKAFFAERGIATAGGITLTIAEGNRFQTFCYTRPEQRAEVKRIIEHTARHFDEIILDDFFFTNCKCPSCIAAKGDQSWTDFRLALMADASRDLIIGPAKAVNPKVKVVIKYPNWYEHFQGLGFNLDAQPKLFDAIYTGTETRDPLLTAQHLQQYESYLIMRYFENIAPGRNDGGWVDTGAMPYLDRYAEQIWLTMFAKARQLTLFDFRQMLWPIRAELRAAWDKAPSPSPLPKGEGMRFSYDAMMQPIAQPDGKTVKPTTMAAVAGYSLRQADAVVGRLGEPVGLASYRPYHATGEDFLQNYLGMIGIPINLAPEFPTDAKSVLLTESAKFDGQIVAKIRRQLTDGKTVIITSGLLRALEGHGIEDIVELDCTDRKALVKDFMIGFRRQVTGSEEMLLPQLAYLTNDSWEEISALAGPNGFPLLQSADYGGGKLYVLVVPDNFADLYRLPVEVLNELRRYVTSDFDVRLAGPSKVSLLLYDNGAMVVESFRDEAVDVQIVADKGVSKIVDAVSGESLSGKPLESPEQGFRRRGPTRDERAFALKLAPHSFRVLKLERAGEAAR